LFSKGGDLIQPLIYAAGALTETDGYAIGHAL